MTNIVIEKNVDLPKGRNKYNHPYKEMEVGDSFFVPEGKLSAICNNNWRLQKILNKKFIARSEGGGVRVWRTE